MTDRDVRITTPDRGRQGSIVPFVPVTLTLPTLAAALGIDGGPIFQMLAIEDLGLSPTAIGVAFGLGIASLPLQLYAARIPIERARSNVQLFLVLAAIQAWILAALLALDATGGLAASALAVTVAAEISLSVLFATAWQPLLSTGVASRDRQRLNSSWAAAARAALAGAVVVFASFDTAGRSMFLVAIGLIALFTGLGLSGIDPSAPIGHADDKSATRGTSLTKPTRVTLLVFAALNLGAQPLWLVYVDQVLWPDANLGLIAAVQTVATMLGLLGWRPTDRDITNRALAATIIGLCATMGLVILDAPIDDLAQQIAVLAITAVLAASTTVARIAMLEAAHRVVPSHNAVKAFTSLDVVASTSLQAGLLVSGILITASVDTSAPVDAYQSFLLVSAAFAIATVVSFQRIAPSILRP